MIDRKDIIEAFEYLISEDCTDSHFDYCPEIEAAISLLKEQETKMVIESENMYTGLPIPHCPKCGKSLDKYLYGRQQEGEINFCPYCGQAVKWE